MTKVTLDKETFKALASDTRLNILMALDGKKMSLKEISKATTLNKATLHEHLTKLREAGLVKKKEREGHKWVYYKLTWKGESLLHPENARIVVLFSVAFIALWIGIIQLIWYIKGSIINLGYGNFVPENEGQEALGRDANASTGLLGTYNDGGVLNAIYRDPMFLYIAIVCFVIFAVVLYISVWKYRKNKTPKF